MKISIYSTAFNAIKNNFDFKGAILNWLVYADEVCIAINTSEDDTYEKINEFVTNNRLNVVLVKTSFSYNDPFCYGKIENSALQACSGDLLIQQNLDERILADKEILKRLYDDLLVDGGYQALFVPVINLYGDTGKYIDIAAKWYLHRRGLNRGPVSFGLKENGLPDYNKTSTDELIDDKGQLVLTYPLIINKSLENLQKYVEKGLPLVYHLGYVNFNDRIERNKFWIEFWEKATGGDKNNHAKSVNELAERMSAPHHLPLWKEISL